MEPQQQKPSVGRIVHFYMTPVVRPLPAMIQRVWSDTCVNLTVFADDGSTFLATSIDLAMSIEGDTSGRKAWVWPPRV